jgi:hypothetical protein
MDAVFYHQNASSSLSSYQAALPFAGPVRSRDEALSTFGARGSTHDEDVQIY